MVSENILAFENLPTGKPHVSYSEFKDWKECSFRHKLRHVDKIDLNKPSPILEFGTAIHAACEDYLKTREMKNSIAIDLLEKSFEEKSMHEGFTQTFLETLKKEAAEILSEVPQFLDSNFQDWELIEAEHMLYESCDEKYPHAFKGYIDVFIKSKDAKGKDLYWVLDWKTSVWGWTAEKKSDFSLQQQLIFYKYFLSKKMNIDFKKIRCGFVLLKRTVSKGKHCELVKVSVGDITTERTLKELKNMLSSVKKNVFLKNRDSCKYCPYKDTKHCT